MKRDYPERPIVGVGAAVWKDDKVLLVRRSKPPRMDDWSLPGGAQNLGETVFEAAIREVREETGIDIKVTGLLDVIDLIDQDESARIRHHYTLIDVMADYSSGDVKAGDDAMDAAWFSLPEALNRVDWDKTRRMLQKSWDMRERQS